MVIVDMLNPKRVLSTCMLAMGGSHVVDVGAAPFAVYVKAYAPILEVGGHCMQCVWASGLVRV